MKTQPLVPTMDDIIFEERNKQYGAYELRRSYPNRLLKSLTITLSAAIAFIFLFSIRKDAIPGPQVIWTTDPTDMSESFEIESKILYRPPQQLNIQKPVIDPNSYVAVLDTMEPKSETDTTVSEMPVTAAATTAGAGTDTIESSGGGGPNTPLVSTPVGLASVEIAPEFPGGLDRFYEFLKKRIRYTKEAMDAGINTRLYVRFVIDENGNVTDVTSVRAVGYGLDQQVRSILAESPKWSPGVIQNTAVKTEMVLPISFSLR